MKFLYQCGICSATYEDSDAAWACENAHSGFDSELDPELRDYREFEPNSAAPKVFYMATSRWNEDGTDRVFTLHEYKLVRTITKGQMYDKVMAAYAARMEKEEEDRRRWRAEWEAQEARRAAEQQQAAEG